MRPANYMDLKDKIFGRLTVLEDSKSRYRGTYVIWKCKCSCGNITLVTSKNLTSGNTTSCGCIKKELAISNGKKSKIDLVNKRFGRLLVLEDSDSRCGSKVVWKCVCDCGNITYVSSGHLRDGTTSSCGCLCAEMKTKHGHASFKQRSREYVIWNKIIQRCINPNYDHFDCYGGRGIKMCDRWRESFTNFLEDMGKCPDGMSIDRINNDGNYEPGNCKWATIYEQTRNMSTNVWVELNGERMVITDAVRLLPISSTGFYLYKKYHGLTHQETVDHYSLNQLRR